MWILTVLVMAVDENGRPIEGQVIQSSSIEFDNQEACNDHAEKLENFDTVWTICSPK